MIINSTKLKSITKITRHAYSFDEYKELKSIKSFYDNLITVKKFKHFNNGNKSISRSIFNQNEQLVEINAFDEANLYNNSMKFEYNEFGYIIRINNHDFPTSYWFRINKYNNFNQLKETCLTVTQGKLDRKKDIAKTTFEYGDKGRVLSRKEYNSFEEIIGLTEYLYSHNELVINKSGSGYVNNKLQCTFKNNEKTEIYKSDRIYDSYTRKLFFISHELKLIEEKYDFKFNLFESYTYQFSEDMLCTKEIHWRKASSATPQNFKSEVVYIYNYRKQLIAKYFFDVNGTKIKEFYYDYNDDNLLIFSNENTIVKYKYNGRKKIINVLKYGKFDEIIESIEYNYEYYT